MLLLLVIISGGCKKYLTELPESEYSVDGSYKTQADFEQAIAGVYNEQQSLFQSNGCWFRTVNARSDETLQGSIVTDDGVAQFIDDANNNWTSGGWNTFYRIIMLNNQILGRIDAAEFNNKALQGYIKGEAHMFRALRLLQPGLDVRRGAADRQGTDGERGAEVPALYPGGDLCLCGQGLWRGHQAAPAVVDSGQRGQGDQICRRRHACPYVYVPIQIQCREAPAERYYGLR